MMYKMLQPEAAKGFPKRIILHGKYCRLEPLNEATHGAGLWTSFAGHDHVWTYLPQGPWANEALFRTWLKECETHPSRFYYTIIDSNSQAMVGGFALMDVNVEHGAIELGGVFFSPAMQRTRIATEAVYLLACYVFDDLAYRRFQWRCNSENEASINAAKRFGFLLEGVFRQHMIVKGRNRNTAWFSMLDSEWELQKSAFEAWLSPENFNSAGKQITKLQGIIEREKTKK